MQISSSPVGLTFRDSRTTSPVATREQPSSGDTIVDEAMQYLNHQRSAPRQSMASFATSGGPITPPNDPIIDSGPSSQLSTDPLESLSGGVKEFVQAMNTLKRLGVEAATLPLPKIVVVGDQSAGKSSLIEGMSGIKVPRSTGTCTRCPLQITLTTSDSPSAAWSCRITLHLKYALYEGVMVPNGEKPPPFHPWRENDIVTTVDFATITDKEDIAQYLHMAQVAILNPRNDPHMYASTAFTPAQQPQEEFSPNVICLDICSPDVPNLSFYDLPGVINQTETSGSRHLVKLVKHLVKAYIRTENSLVLLAMSLENDFANSSAAKLVQDERSDGSNVFVVCTKPDRLPAGTPAESLIDILSRKKYAIGSHCFVTKQASQLELDEGILQQTARLREEEFFATHEPWSTRLSNFNDHFGTKKLQLFLARQLAHQIHKCLPTIADQVAHWLQYYEDELQGLPDPPSTNAYSKIMETLTTFTQYVDKHVEGVHPHNTMQLHWKVARSRFVKAITKDLMPFMTKKTTSDQDRLQKAKEATRELRELKELKTSPSKRSADVYVVSDDEDRQSTPVETPSKRPRYAVVKAETRRSSVALESPRTPQEPRATTAERVVFSLDDVRQTLDDFTASSTPGTVDPRAVNYLSLQCLQNWQTPLTAFYEDTERTVRQDVEKMMNECLKQWHKTPFFDQVKAAVHTFITEQLAAQRTEHGPRTLHNEQLRPMTESEELLKYFEHKERTVLVAARKVVREDVLKHEHHAQTGKPWTPAEQARKVAELLPDPFSREVGVVSHIRGYYNVAAFRFVDNICQFVTVELFEHFRASSLLSEITSALGLSGDGGDTLEASMRLLSEDPSRESRRIELKKLRDNFLKAKAVLEKLDEKYRPSTF